MPDFGSAGLTAPVLRSQLETPTFNVSLLYLISIDDADFFQGGITTFTSYTDVGLYNLQFVNGSVNTGVITATIRQSFVGAGQYSYWVALQSGSNTLYKFVNGSLTSLGTDSTSSNANGQAVYMVVSATGTTIKSFQQTAGGTAGAVLLQTVFYTPNSGSPQISVTDSSVTSGTCGSVWHNRIYEQGAGINSYTFANALSYRIVPAQSPLPPTQLIVESDVIGDGSLESPFGSTLPAGHNWGAIDFRSDSLGKPISNTMLSSITLPTGTIESKGRRYAPPFDIEAILSDAKKDGRDWLIGKNELRHQITGGEVLETDAVADFYERELSSGRLNDRTVTPRIWGPTIDQHLAKARHFNRNNAHDRLSKLREKF